MFIVFTGAFDADPSRAESHPEKVLLCDAVIIAELTVLKLKTRVIYGSLTYALRYVRKQANSHLMESSNEQLQLTQFSPY